MGVTKNSTIPWFFELLIVLYIFHTTLPAMGYYTPAIVHGITLFILYFMLLTYDKFFGQNVVKSLLIFPVYILSFIYNGFSDFAKDIYWLLQIFVYPLLTLYLMRYAGRKTLKRILICIGISYLITAITTYIGNLRFPLASRIVVSTDDISEANFYRSLNIGGFNIVYAWVLLIPVVMYMIRNKMISLFLALIILTIITAAVIVSEYSTGLFVLLLTIPILLLMRKIGNKQVIALIVFSILVVTVFDQYLFPYLSNFTGIFGSDEIDQRLIELSEFSVGKETYEGDLGARYKFYMISWKSFINNPLLGSKDSVAGGHSYILDTMAHYGLVGVLGLVVMYLQLYKTFYKPFSNTNFYGYALYSFYVALTLAFLNPKDNMFVLTFMIPVTATLFAKKIRRL